MQKYYLERVVNQVGANCVVLALPMFGRRWVLPESAVEPGPGSFNLVGNGFHHGYNEVRLSSKLRPVNLDMRQGQAQGAPTLAALPVPLNEYFSSLGSLVVSLRAKTTLDFKLDKCSNWKNKLFEDMNR